MHQRPPIGALEPAEAAMQRFRRQATRLTFLAHSVRYLTLGCISWGTIVLILRAALDVSPTTLQFGALLLPCALLAAVWTSRRHPISDSALGPLFDRTYQKGGLLMAAGEVDLGAWPRDLSLPLENRQRIRWRARGSVSRLSLAVVFLFASFVLPTKFGDVLAAQRLEIDAQLDVLEEQIVVLEEEKWLEEPQSHELRETLSALRQEASGDDPAEAFETLDHVQEMALWNSVQGAQASLADSEKLAAAAAVAEAINSQSELDQQLTAESMDEVAAMLEEMAESSPWLSPELAEQLQQAAATSPAELANALASGAADLQASLDRLKEAGLLDAETIQRIEQSQAQQQQQALEEFLSQNRMQASQKVLQYRRGTGQQMGRGEIQRGPGHAPLTARDEAAFDAELRPEVLSASSLGEALQSEILGERWVAPDAGAATGSTTGGGLDSSRTHGGAAWTHTVLPRHRRAVRDFFDPDSSQAEESTEGSHADDEGQR